VFKYVLRVLDIVEVRFIIVGAAEEEALLRGQQSLRRRCIFDNLALLEYRYPGSVLVFLAVRNFVIIDSGLAGFARAPE
jgi:hypothetical protein